MPFRILKYMVRIWDNYIKEHEKESRRKDFKLPLIISVVFYDGTREWKVEKDFKRKVKGIGKKFDRYIPRFGYEVVDVGRIGEEKIEKMKKALGILLGIDGAKKGEIKEVIEWIKKIYEELPKEEKEIVKRYIKIMLISLYGKEEIEKDLEKVEEVGEMLKIMEERRRKELEEERMKAKEEGIKEGKKKAKIELAEKLLLKKFGEKIKEFLPKIENLNADQLEEIIENIFDIEFNQLIEKYLKK